MNFYRMSLIILSAFLLMFGCAKEAKIEITSGLDACHTCNMNINTLNQAAGMVVGQDFLTYDSPKCLLRDIESLPDSFTLRNSDIYMADYESSELISAESIVMVLTDHVPTVMNGRVVCFSSAEKAAAFVKHDDEIITDWVGFQTLRGTPDLTVEVTLSHYELVPNLIEANKGDLLVVRVHSTSTQQGLQLSVRGYEEVEPVELTADNEYTDIRLLLTKPGAGFPIVDQSGHSYGMIRVAGAHTEEEAQL
ncbi:nosL [bacterium BMS3Bbin04]|nr:nosL [bacterium BMS3Bbin04]